MNARGEAIIIGTVILIVVVLVSGGIVSYYTIKQAGSVEASCLEALNKVKFVDVGFSCKMSDVDREMTSFSVKIVDDSVEGFNLGLESAGTALPYEIKQGAQHAPLCLLDSVFGGALVVPRAGDTLTYVARGNIQKLFISPILKGGKNCYSEARSEIEISNECINPAVENRLVACLGNTGGGAVCGNGNLDAGETCDDGNRVNDDGCSYPACQIESCSVTNLHWSDTNVRDGELVNLLADVTTCGDERFSFTVKEDDLPLGPGGTDTAVTTAPATFVVSQGSRDISRSWTAEWLADTQSGEANPPEYYFILAIQGGASFMSSIELAKELRITKCGDGIVQSEEGEVCEVVGSVCNVGTSETSGTCSNNCICNASPEPELGEASWTLPRSVTEGDTVQIRVTGTNVANLPILIDVWEYDPLGTDELITTTPLTATFNSAGFPILKDYTSTWQCDGKIFNFCSWGNPEYYIKARLRDTAGNWIQSSWEADLMLTVFAKIPTCENGIIQPPEECDPTTTCTPLYGGSCTRCASCRVERVPGSICGDNILNVGFETCDGIDLGGQDCVKKGYVGGTLGCKADCKEFDFTQCVIGGAVCGNNVVEAPEVCDGTDLAGEDCISQGYAGGGTLGCQADCSGFEISACSGSGTLCGNGNLDPGEACDPPGSTQSCTTSGSGTSGLTGQATNENGVQTCSATCQWNTCTVTPAV